MLYEVITYYLEQSIKNYINNAVSHTENGNDIRLSLEQKDDKAVFSVFNQGKNIPEEDIDHIWESFYKTDKSRIRSTQNNVGLGLYIVRTITEAHNGEYAVENLTDGVRFWFSIPLA